jgi:hypothetical protein
VIRTVAVTGDGVYVGGDFSEGIFRLNEDGSLDNTFDVGSGFNDSVSTIVPVGDGSGEIYVGGFFSQYKGSLVSGLVRLSDEGKIIQDYGATSGIPPREIQAVAMAGMDGTYPDGSVYSGGEVIPRLQRWSEDGTIDVNFNPLVTDGPVFSLALVAGGFGAVYAGGGFTGGLYRYDEFGNRGVVFSGFNDSVRKIVHTKDALGDIYAVGEFTTYQGAAANGLVRLKDDGSRETSFMTGTGFSNSDGLVAFGQFATSALAADASGVVYVNGDLYVGGDFTDYDGTAADGIVRLDNSGMLDADFDARISSETGTCIDGTFVEDV